MTQPNPKPPEPPADDPNKQTPPADDPNKGNDTPPADDPNKKDGEPPEPPAGGEDVVEINSIVKDADGNYVLIIDPDDPKSTVYKGATIDELITNAKTGFKEKDSYINKLKGEGLVPTARKEPPAPSSRREPAESAPQFVEYGSILEQVLKEQRIDPEFVRYTDDDWKKLEDEHGLRKVLRIENAVERAKQEADRRYSLESAKIINDQTLDEEEATIQEVLQDYGVSEQEFAPKYEEILETILSDEKNFKNGVRKSGRIVGAAMRAIKGMVEPNLRKEIEQKIAQERVIKGTIRTDGQTGKPPRGAPEKNFNNTEEVMEDILRDLRLKQK